MTKISATVVADSLNPQGNRLTSLLLTFPRFILAELNTHRMLSKNSASSRAIPFRKMVEIVKNSPFIPIAWQKDHKGMQGTEYLTNGAGLAKVVWLSARDMAVEQAEMLAHSEVTKQLCNRLLEPFMWHTVLISGTDEGWENFFELRCPQYKVGIYNDYDERIGEETFRSRKDASEDPRYFHSNDVETQKRGAWAEDMTELDWLYLNKGQAEIHMMALAEAIWDAMNESKPKQLKAGEWHMIFENKIIDLLAQIDSGCHSVGEEWTKDKIKIATAMAARTSYTVVGDEKEISYEKLVGIHDRMIAQVPFHASPFEHCARAMSDEEYVRYVKGKLTDGRFEIPNMEEDGDGWCRNYRGFIQYRHFVETNAHI